MFLAVLFIVCFVVAFLTLGALGFFARGPKPYTNKVMQAKREAFLRSRKF